MRSLAFHCLFIALLSLTLNAQYQGNISLATAPANLLGNRTNDQSGHHVAIVPDLNQDGFDEFLITAPLSDWTENSLDNGSVYLFYGRGKAWNGSLRLDEADVRFYGAFSANEASHDAFGIGDIDQDGYNDLAISIKRWNPSDSQKRIGKVYLFFGGSSKWQGSISLESADASLVGDVNLEEAAHVKGVDDLNGDGYDDFIVGAGFNSQMGAEAGKVYVFFGKPRNQWTRDASMENACDASYLAEDAGNWMGHRVSGLGDVNGDGFGDMLISANNLSVNSIVRCGGVYLVLGKASGWSKDVNIADADASWIGNKKNQSLGWNVARIGDVDGDGLADILFSEKSTSTTYLILANKLTLGSHMPISGVQAVVIGYGTAVLDDIGHDIDGLGDIDNDGYDDFLIGNSLISDPVIGDATGCAYLFKGRATWPTSMLMAQANAVFIGESAGDGAGFSVSGNGDVDGDHSKDFIISAYKNDESAADAGKSYLFTTPSSRLVLLSPNGGEILPAAAPYTITWTSSNLNENVEIEYSVDLGSTWDIIAADSPNDGLYEWNVPERPSSQCLLRISAASTKTIADASDAAFEIAGEEFPTTRIEAENSNFSSNYAPESRDEASNGQVIKLSKTAANGQLTIVHALPKALYKIFVRYLDEIDGRTSSSFQINGSSVKQWSWDIGVSSDVYVYYFLGEWNLEPGDLLQLGIERDNGEYGRIDFVELVQLTQPQELTVLSPNGGENWLNGSSQTINWHSLGTSGNVDIALSRDDGTTWELLAQNLTDNGAYVWNVTPPTSNLCRIRVADADGDPADVSDSAFEISAPPVPKITVTIPNGGEQWEIESVQTITWLSENSSGAVKIELSRDHGLTWSLLSDNTADDGDFEWSVVGPASSECLMRISDLLLDAGDISDSTFSILEKKVPMISVMAPNGGEEWFIGDIESISWNSQHVDSSVTIELSRDGGTTWEIIRNQAENSGAFDWKITSPNCDSALVRISADHVTDVSDSFFSIHTRELPQLTIKTPNGGEKWEIGFPKQILWSSSLVQGQVKIELSRDGGSEFEVIEENGDNDGVYTWIVAEPVSDKCLVRISAQDGSAMDTSDAPFSIVAAPSLSIASPNGGEKWLIGDLVTIRWNSVSTSGMVKIQLTRDNGLSWEDLTAETEDDGLYEWVVTAPVSDACLVYIADIDGIPIDISDGFFTIDFTVGVRQITAEIPQEYALMQNYPNPFNPETNISFHIPKASNVSLTIYNIQGSIVRHLIDGRQSAGIFTIAWDGKDDLGQNVPTGVYFYQLQADEFEKTMRLLLAK
ncbi:MAG: T9SS C-terminal target domain-containing protein [Calditrichaeota bacterium]|nr:MAG: T9SS C-terminal target domain-containing protein [Calditrichota bacterium]